MCNTKNIKLTEIIVEVICFLYALLFIYAATSKLNGFQQFKDQLDQSTLLVGYGHWAAWLVPLSELVLALLLLIRPYRLFALYGSLGLMSLFSAYIIVVLNYSDHIPCSCGGVISSMGWETHLVFNICWMGLALIGIVLMGNQKKSTSKNTT
ncbi:MauE/DoxX family redox-associated membrane protein [Flagellimonas aurea]|uniref:MauE/DoxX family redox-associated membrane protein n=1 Tax=Flagellimonas aurea TaxID=2915619 RepID=UPI0035D059EF